VYTHTHTHTHARTCTHTRTHTRTCTHTHAQTHARGRLDDVRSLHCHHFIVSVELSHLHSRLALGATPELHERVSRPPWTCMDMGLRAGLHFSMYRTQNPTPSSHELNPLRGVCVYIYTLSRLTLAVRVLRVRLIPMGPRRGAASFPTRALRSFPTSFPTRPPTPSGSLSLRPPRVPCLCLGRGAEAGAREGGTWGRRAGQRERGCKHTHTQQFAHTGPHTPRRAALRCVE
jgi:hypothetical protein